MSESRNESGPRVVLVNDVERYPHGIAPRGLTGRVVYTSELEIRVRLDAHLPWLDEWSNALAWYPEHAPVGAESIGAVGAAALDLRVLPEVATELGPRSIAPDEWTDTPDDIGDATGTVECEACEGGRWNCDGTCYRGRIAGYRESMGPNGPTFRAAPCHAWQRAAVDAWHEFNEGGRR